MKRHTFFPNFVCVVLALSVTEYAHAAKPIPRLEDLTKPRYEALSDSAPLIRDGKRTTKAEIRAESLSLADRELKNPDPAMEREVGERMRELRRASATAETSFATRELANPERVRNTKPVDRATLAAVRKEASLLEVRARTASREELREIDKRAGELLQQLQNSP